MGRRGDPDWRDRASGELLLGLLPARAAEGVVLVAGDPRPEVAQALGARGWKVVTWSRRALGGRVATPWPPAGPFAWVALRLPRDKGELRMTAHASASVLAPGGILRVFGAKDEGIGAIGRSLEPCFSDLRVLGVGGHCRVVEARRASATGELKGTLEAWREAVDTGFRGLPASWASYPGVFAHGRLDPGTRLLLEALPPFPPGARVLDYGCGSGVVGGWLREREEGIRLDLLDVDAVALESARENVPGARFLLRDGLPPREEGPWDAIVSNPPFHRGKVEDPSMITALVLGAPEVLTPGGRLVLVAQRRMGLEGVFREAFRSVTALGEDRAFRVWEGTGPRRPS